MASKVLSRGFEAAERLLDLAPNRLAPSVRENHLLPEPGMDINLFFGTEGNVTWWQELLRAFVVFWYGLIAVRLAGRRVFGKWAALDIVVSVVVGSNLSRAIIGAPLIGTLLATTAVLAIHWLLAHAAARSLNLSRLFEGRAIRLAENGILKRGMLLRHAVSDADLREAARAAGVDELHDCRLVVLEPSGKLVVLTDNE